MSTGITMHEQLTPLKIDTERSNHSFAKKNHLHNLHSCVPCESSRVYSLFSIPSGKLKCYPRCRQTLKFQQQHLQNRVANFQWSTIRIWETTKNCCWISTRWWFLTVVDFHPKPWRKMIPKLRTAHSVLHSRVGSRPNQLVEAFIHLSIPIIKLHLPKFGTWKWWVSKKSFLFQNLIFSGEPS